MLVKNLVGSEPNFTIEIVKREYVVNKWLGLRVIFWSVENLE